MRSTIAILTAAAVAGCTQQPEPTASPAQPAPPPATAGAMPAAVQPPADPNEVLADVNGTALKRGEAQAQVELRSAQLANRLPPGQLAAARAQIGQSVVEQFVMRTLLLNESARVGIEVTPEDEKQAFDRIRENLPEGVTLEEVLERSPVGEERMREEVLVGIRINKLLEQRMAALDITEDELTAYLADEDNAERVTIPENVHARHILITVDPEDDDEAKAEKRTRIDQLRQKLVDGADFAKTASEHSDCPSSRRGGDLGTFGRGQMVKAFEDAAFGQATNEIGPVIETRFGFHIVQTLAHREAGTMERDQVADIIRGEKQQSALLDVLRELSADAEITYADSVRPVDFSKPPMPPPGR